MLLLLLVAMEWVVADAWLGLMKDLYIDLFKCGGALTIEVGLFSPAEPTA